NTMTSPVTWSFTTIVPLGNGPFSIWSAPAAPVTANDPDAQSTEVGVRFRSDVAGSVVGLRFYKGASNTGTHVGTLWTNTGTALASATFTGETASGWQQVNFASPVSISANTTYVASYHAPNGHYAEDDNSFTASGVHNPPLRARSRGRTTRRSPRSATAWTASTAPTPTVAAVSSRRTSGWRPTTGWTSSSTTRQATPSPPRPPPT